MEEEPLLCVPLESGRARSEGEVRAKSVDCLEVREHASSRFPLG